MATNPFSSRFIRPGAVPFLFPTGCSSTLLVQQLRDRNWWGQIIGPHGSGKSTLVATMMGALQVMDRDVIAVGLRQGERRVPPIDRSRLSVNTQVIIDGYEQLSWWSRWRIKSLCRRCQAGLLVTAHHDVGLPTLYCTQPSEELVREVVARLIPNADGAVSPNDISTAYAAAGGNMRETLFRLYDVYQQRR